MIIGLGIGLTFKEPVNGSNGGFDGFSGGFDDGFARQGE